MNGFGFGDLVHRDGSKRLGSVTNGVCNPRSFKNLLERPNLMANGANVINIKRRLKSVDKLTGNNPANR